MKLATFTLALFALATTGLSQMTVTSTAGTCMPTNNSTGSPGVLDGFGTFPDLTLTYSNLPAGQWAQVIFAPRTCPDSSIVIGDGTLCVCGNNDWSICRGLVFNTGSGSGSVLVDLDDPVNPGQPCSNVPIFTDMHEADFQIYHRDTVGTGVNLTNGVEVDFG